MPSKRKNGKAKRNKTSNSTTVIHPDQDLLHTVFMVSSKTVVPRNVQLEIGQRVQWTYKEAGARQQNMSPRIKCEGLFESDKLTPSKPSFAYTFRSRGLYEVVISSRLNILQSIKVVPTEGECYTESDSFADSDDDFSDDNFPYVTADNPASDHDELERSFVAAEGNFVANESSSTETGACELHEIEPQICSSEFADIAVTKRQRNLISQHSASSSVNSEEDDKKEANLVILNSLQDSDLRSDNGGNEKFVEPSKRNLDDLPSISQVYPSNGLEIKSHCPHNPLVEGENGETHVLRFALEQPYLNCIGDSTSPLVSADVSQREDTFTSDKESFVPGVCGVEESKICSVASFAKGSPGSDEECARDDRSAKTAPVESPQETPKEYPWPPLKPHKAVNNCKKMSAKAVRRKQKRQASVKPHEISESVQMGDGKQLEVSQADALANGTIKKKVWSLKKKTDSDTTIVATKKGQKVEATKKKSEQHSSSTSRRVESHPLSTSPSGIESPKLTERKVCDRPSLPKKEESRCGPGKQDSKILSRKQSKENLLSKKQRTPLRENIADQADEQTSKPFYSTFDERPVTQQEPQEACETLHGKDNLVDMSKQRAPDSNNEAALSSTVSDDIMPNGMHVRSPKKGEESDCFNEAVAEQILLERWRKIERLISSGKSEGVPNF